MEDKLREFFNSRFSDLVIKEENFRDQQAFYIKPEGLFDICDTIINDPDLDVKYLADITVIDWYEHDEAKDGRYEVVYVLYSIPKSYRFMLKVRLDGDPPRIRSLVDLWEGANWMEREAFDLFGVIFEGHPELEKILTPDELEGHPLRKDYPLTWEQPKFTWNIDDPPEVIK